MINNTKNRNIASIPKGKKYYTSHNFKFQLY